MIVKSVIVVGLGKGGVGKSMVVIYLVFSFCKVGCCVGLLDIDVYGFSVF